MPIVNGQYVPDQYPEDQIGKLSAQDRRDWSDSRTARYNYILKQQENAYNLDLWNLSNQYNSPAAQMQRYQDAGLNPNLIYSQQNTTSPISAAQNAAFRSQGTQARRTQNQLATIGQIESLVKSAAETYDYLRFGRNTSGWNMLKAQESANALHLQNEWDSLLLEGPGDENSRSEFLSRGPRYQLWSLQKDTAMQNYERMKFMVSSMLPTQEARQRALTELDKYQLDFMKGKYGAVLDIDLGLGDTVNQWARMLMFIALAQMM